MWCSKCHEAAHTFTVQKFDIILTYESAFGVTDDGETALDVVFFVELFDFVVDFACGFFDGVGVEGAKETTKIEGENRVTILAQSVLHDIQSSARGAKAINHEHWIAGVFQIGILGDAVSRNGQTCDC